MSKKSQRAGAGICLILLSICLTVTTISAETEKVKVNLKGQPVPVFELNTLYREGQVSLKEDIEGKKTIIYFWATWCVNCLEKLQHFDSVKDQFVAQNTALVVINLGEPEEVVRKYVKRYDLSMDMFLDVDSSLEELYGLEGLPTVVFVDEQGIVANVQHSIAKPKAKTES